MIVDSHTRGHQLLVLTMCFTALPYAHSIVKVKNFMNK